MKETNWKSRKEEALKYFKLIHPDRFRHENMGLLPPIQSYSFGQIGFQGGSSDIKPDSEHIDLSMQIGPVTLNTPFLSAVMNTVSGPPFGKVAHEFGFACVLDRSESHETQLRWASETLNHRVGLNDGPIILSPRDLISEAAPIRKDMGFSTIPIIMNDKLKGVFFSHGFSFEEYANDKISRWMTKIKDLKVVYPETSFHDVKKWLLDANHRRGVLPLVDAENNFLGIYFMKDVMKINAPSFFNGKPLVGIAVGSDKSDLDFIENALDLGVGIVVVDSSHGNCTDILEQTRKIVKLVDGQAAVIAGNIHDIEGFLNFMDCGVDAVKIGIGTGNACTTSEVTGCGMGNFTALTRLAYLRKLLIDEGRQNVPLLVIDGGVSGPGQAVIALMSGAHVIMAGEWFVGALESASAQNKIWEIPGTNKAYVEYYGMASKRAIEQRIQSRYIGYSQKTASEGISKFVPYKGSLRDWFPKHLELIYGGFAHAGCKNIKEIHEYGDQPDTFNVLPPKGLQDGSIEMVPSMLMAMISQQK